VLIDRRISGIQRPHEGFAATQIHQASGSGFFRDNVLVEASEAAIYNVLPGQRLQFHPLGQERRHPRRLSRRRRRLPRTADGCRAVRFDVCLVDHLHVCRFARTRDDLCKTDGDDDFRSSNGSGEAGRQREWYELTSLDYSKVSLSAPITW
jgi:hypothetical protein